MLWPQYLTMPTIGMVRNAQPPSSDQRVFGILSQGPRVILPTDSASDEGRVD